MLYFFKIGDLYKEDPLDLELAEDFWISLDNEGYSPGFPAGYGQKAIPKQVCVSLLHVYLE